MPPGKNMIDRKVRMSQENLRTIETAANRAGSTVPKYLLSAGLSVAADVPPENLQQAVEALSATLDAAVLKRIDNMADEEGLTVPQYWQASAITQATDTVGDNEECSAFTALADERSMTPDDLLADLLEQAKPKSVRNGGSKNPLKGESPERVKRIEAAAKGLNLTVEAFLIEAAIMVIHLRARSAEGARSRGRR